MESSERDKGDLDDATYADVNYDKTQVLQEAKQCFMATSVKTSKLVDVLTKCIYIMLKGDKLSSNEATDLFFHITRLFQYKDKDNTLRRLTYIGIKTLSHQAENVYVITSSLTTDVNSYKDDPAVRASALRALCQISDASTFTSIEPYLRQSVVDKHPVVASAALTSLIRIAQVNGEIVRRCTNEIQEALNSDSPMVQYHALALLYKSCNNDRSSTSRLLASCIDLRLKSPLAICLLLRIIAKSTVTLDDDTQKSKRDYSKPYISFARDCLSQTHSETVKYEAASVLLELAKSDPAAYKTEETIAMSHLRNLLTAPKPALRFAAIRLLNEYNATSLDTRLWAIHRVGGLCKLHLLIKRYKPGDEIVGVIEFSNSSVVCVKYNCILQCEEAQQFEIKQEFSLGYKRSDFTMTIPCDMGTNQGPVLHCMLSFLFYIASRNYPRTLFEDKAGTIELGPSELETKQFSCDFPILIYT